MTDLTTTLGPLELVSPLIAASGTVGSVVDFVEVGSLEQYGAAVAKSVSAEPWTGRPAPRIAAAGAGMLNGIGIQNPGVDVWADEVGPHLDRVPTRVFGSAVGHTPGDFARVAAALEEAGVEAVEVNLSCPNLEDGSMFALDAGAAAEVVASVRRAVALPIGAKLSPNAVDIAAIAGAVHDAGADWVVLTNTVWGAGIDIHTKRPRLSGTIGGYSGPPLKPIALRCVIEVHRALPGVPIVGCGGVASGEDVLEFLLAGASAVAVGSAHFAEPRVGRRIIRELERLCASSGTRRAADLVGRMEPW
jgi:dihydroorotate dehydrogenase (NAD+) catalytic subunit